jgi:hypothetical protein
MSTNGLTFALMKRLIWLRSGSLETRSTDLEIGPEKLLVSTEVWTFPSPPGLINLSNEATVQPQPGRASVMIRSDAPLFLITKVVSMTCPLGTVPASRVSGMTSILGPLTALPPGLAGAFAPFSCAPAAAAKTATATTRQAILN